VQQAAVETRLIKNQRHARESPGGMDAFTNALIIGLLFHILGTVEPNEFWGGLYRFVGFLNIAVGIVLLFV
jgi:hypothetical protein